MRPALPLALGLLFTTAVATGLVWAEDAGGADPAATAGAPADAATSSATPAPTQVVAVVNGHSITMADVTAVLEALGPQAQQMPLELIYERLLDQLVTSQLVVAEAEAAGLPQQPQIQAALDLAADQVLVQLFLQDRLAQLASDEAVRSLYDQTIAGQPGETQVHARHILLESEEDARAVIAELDAGADFEELARTRSTGPTAEQAGDLGFFSRGQMVPPFEEAAFALEPGTYTPEPVQTQFGWHVIRVEEKRDAEPPAFEAVEQDLRQQLMGQLAETYLAQLRSQAEVQLFGLDGQPLAAAGEAAPAAEAGSTAAGTAPETGGAETGATPEPVPPPPAPSPAASPEPAEAAPTAQPTVTP